MDYDIINSAIDDIVDIVNQYNKNRRYDVSVCEKLVISLLGYYLVFGPAIFSKIGVVLDALQIIQSETSEACIKEKEKLRPPSGSTVYTAAPSLLWDYKYVGEESTFIGAVPIILYFNEDMTTDVFNVIHELSHALEGVTAKIMEETSTYMRIKHGMGDYLIEKSTGAYTATGHGMTELITAFIANRTFKEMLKLDHEQISNPLVKDFLGQLNVHQDKNTIIKSYPALVILYKDLMDNDIFFEMLKEHYYETESELLTEKFDSLDKRLNFKRLLTYADMIYNDESINVITYLTPIRKQLDVLNETTEIIPDKRMIFMA